jgi:uncharacterized membrane protein
MKIINRVTMVILALLLVASIATALPVTVDRVEIDDIPVSPDAETLDVKRTESLDIRVVFTPSEDLENVEVRADIAGFEFNDNVNERLSDVVFVGNVFEGVTYPVDLNVPLNTDAEIDRYTLSLEVRDRNDRIEQIYNLNINTNRRDIEIVDVHFMPGNTVKAGQAILAKVRLENKGQVDEDDVRVTVSIPELGVSQRAFINEIENKDDEEETEELYLRVPVCAEGKTYDVKVEADYAKGRESTSTMAQIQVEASELCDNQAQEKLQVTLGSDKQTLTVGEQVSYPITIMNEGLDAQSYTLSVQAPQGISVQVTPSTTVVLDAGKSQVLHMFATADKTAQKGPQVIQATLTNGQEVLTQLSFTADVAKAGKSVARTLLEVVLVVLVIILVILGIMVGFSRMKENRQKTEPYY